MAIETLWKKIINLPKGFRVKTLGAKSTDQDFQPTGSQAKTEIAAGLQLSKPADPNLPIRLEVGLQITAISTSGDKVTSVKME